MFCFRQARVLPTKAALANPKNANTKLKFRRQIVLSDGNRHSMILGGITRRHQTWYWLDKSPTYEHEITATRRILWSYVFPPFDLMVTTWRVIDLDWSFHKSMSWRGAKKAWRGSNRKAGSAGGEDGGSALLMLGISIRWWLWLRKFGEPLRVVTLKRYWWRARDLNVFGVNRFSRRKSRHQSVP